jgi:hypothetical protein
VSVLVVRGLSDKSTLAIVDLQAVALRVSIPLGNILLGKMLRI